MAKRKQKAEDSLSYGEAVTEVETILESIDRDEVDVDELSEKVERAVQLLRQCREKLRVTDAKVQEVLADIEEVVAEPTVAAAPPEAPEQAPSSPKAASGRGGGPSGAKASKPVADAGGDRPPLRDEDYAEEDDELPF